MSYFAAGYHAKATVCSELAKSFADVVPEFIAKDVWNIDDGSSFLLSYGPNKAINDLLFRDFQTGSWLAILGTPLVDFPTPEARSAFLRRFFESPQDLLNREIDGCFALLSYDAYSDTFRAATDPNNTVPIYYSVTNGGVIFSSHELQLARILRPQMDPLGFALAINLKVAWGSFTRFKNIRKLLPCQVVEFRGDGTQHAEFYWHPSDESIWPDDFDEILQRWLAILKDSVEAYCRRSSEAIVYCDFTAGEDSRLLLSQCHALSIPFRAQVTGLDDDVDVIISTKAARKVGFELEVRRKSLIAEKDLLDKALQISIQSDGYQDMFKSCTEYATDAAYPVIDYRYIKLCGLPGGEAFRGSYYLRGKALFPGKIKNLDHQFFTRMKYMLDFHDGLFCLSDEECKKAIFRMIEESLTEVKRFPIGIKIDHLLRMFQTSFAGLMYKSPLYLPFASNQMTRSIYCIPPQFKRGGKLTKACTEILYPELATIRTQKGVPTIRKTAMRSVLFLPEYAAILNSVAKGTVCRLLKWSDSNKPAYKWSENSPAIATLLSKSPYSDWFSSSRSMITGHLYRKESVESLLSDARAGSTKYVPILGRVINQELACRWVFQ
jgi:hypothetical protein